MPKLKSPEDLKRVQERELKDLEVRLSTGASILEDQPLADPSDRASVLVCRGTGCVSSGSVDVMSALSRELENRGLEQQVNLERTGCHGLCALGPIVIVYPGGIFYCSVQADDVPELVEETLLNGRVVEKLLYQDPETGQTVPLYQDIPFYKKQQRLVLSNCGFINPERIGEYIARGGYSGLSKALFDTTPEQVINEIKQSGLRGRGGAGFPTGLKWQFCIDASGDEKYVICNADEGDPGAFMNRSLLEGDPHSVLEGILIAGHTIGAKRGYIYCRAEYPLALERLRIAIGQMRDYGLLGDNLFGSGFSFDIEIKQGAGAFVCGEETALIASIEGKRGMPTPRPPFPAVSGLFGKPTIINNVETLANVAIILRNGAEWFAQYGTEKSKGTKTFALVGKVKHTGLVEVPLGMTLREVVFGIGGGVQGDREFKAIQTGGPSGGCLPASLLDSSVDYESLAAAGSIMGSGGMVVMDEDNCMVDVARYFLDFTQKESCGKCVPCRLGTKQMLDILQDITEGRGRPGDIELLEEMADAVKKGSLCALGQTAPNPVLTTIRYFRNEYEAHIDAHQCPALSCKAFIRYQIDPEKCKACGLCRKECPTDAIWGEKKTPHIIDQSKCIKCGVCQETCPVRFGAIARVSEPFVDKVSVETPTENEVA
jgi:NADH:ubiquinone oxidoreductase subunit F (NADH-binding)/(2Fe-2S) ferredoxin/NAD-dependent dihydropyrimidine dehydrogenase PreA subunit